MALTVGETAHHTNEYLCVVATSSRARKGDSSNVALRTLREADPDWAANVTSGLSSGEGLIYHARDALTALKTLSDLGMVTVERDDTTGGRPRIVVGRADPARITDGHEATNAAALVCEKSEESEKGGQPGAFPAYLAFLARGYR
jgi:hypothetical protein